MDRAGTSNFCSMQCQHVKEISYRQQNQISCYSDFFC